MTTYYRYFIKKNIAVKNLVTIEYLTIGKGFKSEEERHAFCEFAYVDKGEIYCFDRNDKHLLKQGELFFTLPQTDHHYEAADDSDTKLFIVCANCKADILEIIRGRNVLEEKERSQISSIFSESKKAFRFPFDKKIVPLENPEFGAQQLTEAYIEILLTRLVRAKLSVATDIKFVMNSEEFNDKVINDVISNLKENVYGKITLEKIAESVHYSKTYINKLFKTNIGTSIMQYYYGLKISEAKKLINEGFSVNEISDKLCYDNPNYFTKAFRTATGLTPSQYKKSINKSN